MKSSWIVTDNLEEIFYMQITVSIIVKSILFNIFETMHCHKNVAHIYVFKVND